MLDCDHCNQFLVLLHADDCAIIWTYRPSIRGQYANWDSTDALIRDRRRSRFKNLQTFPNAQRFRPTFLDYIRIYSSNFMSLSIMTPRSFCSLLSHTWLWPIFAYNQIKVSDICHHIVTIRFILHLFLF